MSTAQDFWAKGKNLHMTAAISMINSSCVGYGQHAAAIIPAQCFFDVQKPFLTAPKRGSDMFEAGQAYEVSIV